MDGKLLPFISDIAEDFAICGILKGFQKVCFAKKKFMHTYEI
jgi:hypothetical protein